MATQGGVDAVEIHGANGSLLQQFLAPNANQRWRSCESRAHTMEGHGHLWLAETTRAIA
jgi:NADH:flavin oxidoreductase / NADH oxidase family